MTRRFLTLSALAAAALLWAPGAQAQCDAPNLLLILDKSSSMVTGTVPSGDTKWEAARQAVNAIVTRFADRIDFGLLVFPNPNHCAVAGTAVACGPDTADDIAGFLATPPPTAGNWTPMYQALDAAAVDACLTDASKRRVVVLVTDGWQWCDPYDAATRFLPVEHAQRVRDTGATLHVVGFGDGVDALTLNRIAYQSGTYLPGCDPTGSTPTTPNACYQKAEDTVSLEAVLDGIARRATEEVCDGIDNDCDDATDETLSRACSSLCGSGSETCSAGAWIACDAPAPAAAEACDGTVDDDCDGVVDEGCECTTGDVRGCGVDAGLCRSGEQTCAAGAWSECAGYLGPAEETCNGEDDDCDGTTDEGCLCAEGDTRACGSDDGACLAGSQTCSGGAWGGCEGSVDPAAESCNAADDDCDGLTDEGCPCATGETRACGTGEGECTAGTQTCRDGAWSDCEGAAWPAVEACNALDDDCNSLTDDNAVCPPGLACRDGVCTEGDPRPDDPPDDPPGEDDAASGCGCSVADGSGLAGSLTLGLLVLLAFTRRRRS